MNLNLGGKRALVTGSSSGIGRAVAQVLAQEGAVVAVHGRNRDRAEETLQSIRVAGGEAHLAIGDLANDEGAAAVVVCRADQAHRYTTTPVYVRGVAVRTRRFGTFEVFSSWVSPESTESPTVDASRAVYEMAGIGPDDVQVAQIQDSESGAEIMHMAENGFCADGDQERMIFDGETEIGGRLPINTDGGLLANGEPIGASGMRQIHEIVLQLRGQAGPRQVPGGPTVGYTQVYGAPGIGACTVLTR